MAQYELTTKQKQTLRKQGHVSITRNGKTIRVTPSMVKATGPAKRATGGKVKARGKGRKGGYEDLVAQERHNAGRYTLSELSAIRRSPFRIITSTGTDGRTCHAGVYDPNARGERGSQSFQNTVSKGATAVRSCRARYDPYGGDAVARARASGNTGSRVITSTKYQTAEEYAASQNDLFERRAALRRQEADRQHAIKYSRYPTPTTPRPGEARYQKFYANNPTYANFIKSIQSRSTPTTTRSSCSRCRS